MSNHYFYLGPPKQTIKSPKERSDMESFPYLDYERQDKFGYFPSCRNYSVIAEDILNPVSANYFWRTNPTFAPGSVRERNKPWDTRHALAIERSNEYLREKAEEEEKEKLEARKALRQRARQGFGSKIDSGGPHLFSYPTLEDHTLNRPRSYEIDPKWYDIGASTSEAPHSSIGRGPMPMDHVSRRRPASNLHERRSRVPSSSFTGSVAIPPGSHYFTDKNYPEYFFNENTSINDMIRKT